MSKSSWIHLHVPQPVQRERGRYVGGRQAEFRDPQVAPKQLATAVSTAKRSQ
eukprot:COSAG03_NODE_16139_length_410_cov_15.659164_1_plen_51_part_01